MTSRNKKITLPDGRKIDKKFNSGRTLVMREDYQQEQFDFFMKEPCCYVMFLYIANHLDKNNRFAIRVKDLAEALKSSPTTTERRIRKLRESGLLHTEISEGKTCFVFDSDRCFVVD